LSALLCLTGQRPNEIARLEWAWLAGDTIEFPASVAKNHRAWTLPIGPEALAILANVKRMAGSPYVFPAQRMLKPTTTVFNAWGECKARFDKACAVTDWQLRDLRRTYATNLQRLGVRLEVTEALLNHVSGASRGIVSVYQRYQWMPEKREAVLKYEHWIATSSRMRK
jgi:integrase